MTRNEKRSWPRIPISLSVRLTANDFESLRNDLTQDISLGGTFLRTINPRPVGTRVLLEIGLTQENCRLHCRGVVVRTIPYDATLDNADQAGMGIVFTTFEEGHEKILGELLRVHLSNYETDITSS